MDLTTPLCPIFQESDNQEVQKIAEIINEHAHLHLKLKTMDFNVTEEQQVKAWKISFII